MIPHALYDNLKRVFATHHWNNKKIIATVSGGADSMALCYVLKHLQADFVIAHCNFQLRGEESNQDAAFVQNWAQENNIRFYIQQFDTRAAIAATGGNLQDTCRKLRYQWFEDLRGQLQYDYIATAHHKNDVVETLMMHLLKGTGIAGLHGILPVQGKIIRPLLGLEKSELVSILDANESGWREDSSNKKDDYLRNKIRHHLVPLMQEIIPQSVNNIYHTSLRMQDVELITAKAVKKQLHKVVEQRGQDYYISINKLVKLEGYATLLYEAVKPFGFSSAQMTDILALLQSLSGKFIVGDAYRIIKNRDFLIITAMQTEQSECILIETEPPVQYRFKGGVLDIKPFNGQPDLSQFNERTIFINANLLEQPLILRPYKTGDYLYPFGMGMKKKKVSKLLKDLKVALHEKEQVWVLESNKKIVWVLGYRMDERFRLKPGTENVLQLHLK